MLKDRSGFGLFNFTNFVSIFVVFGLSCGASAKVATLRSMKRMKPAWSWQSPAQNPNMMTLNSREGGYFNIKVKDIRDQILDQQSTVALRQQFVDMNREYEARRYTGTQNQVDHRNYIQRNSNFTQGILRQIVDFQIDQSMKKAEKSSEQGRSFKRIHDQVQSVIKGSTTVEFNPQVKFGTKTNLREQEIQFWSESPLARISLDVNMASSLLGSTFLSDPAKSNAEKFSVNASRKIPVLDINANVSYAVVSTKMRTALSRSVYKNVSAELVQTRGLDRFKSGYTQREEAIALNYGIQF